jgi:hypothetical protein
MRIPLPLPVLALLAAACGSKDGSDEPVGDPSPAELASRIERIATERPAEEKAKAAPRRLGVLTEAQLPPEYRAGATCRLTQGNTLLLVAAAPGALATIDGRVRQLRIAGPVGPSGGFFESPGATVSIGLKPPGGAVPGTPTTRAGATVGGGSPETPLERHDAAWLCVG